MIAKDTFSSFYVTFFTNRRFLLYTVTHIDRYYYIMNDQSLFEHCFILNYLVSPPG
jgi:hypothetical protein